MPKNIKGFQKGNKLAATNFGEKSGTWKGDDAKPHAIHQWVMKWKGQPAASEGCGKENLSGHAIQWANIDHKYRRTLDDYIRFCVVCHREYDAIHHPTVKNYKLNRKGQ